jgi:hypothetical protein
MTDKREKNGFLTSITAHLWGTKIRQQEEHGLLLQGFNK